MQEDHGKRLANLMPCEETNYVVPCKVGEIIVEEINGDNVEVIQTCLVKIDTTGPTTKALAGVRATEPTSAAPR